jgi:4-carboxymuconolactone decarboxylase
MDRVTLSEQKIQALAVKTDSLSFTDQDFFEGFNRFLYGEVFYKGSLTDRQRELITLVVLTANQCLPQIKEHVEIALNAGVSPVEIKEAIYHCAPYAGYPKAINALNIANEVFKEKNISMPLKSQQQVTENERYDKGLKVEVELGGQMVVDRLNGAPQTYKHLYEFLAAWCFGDFFTRGGLDIKTRELLTLCIISSLGGCDAQVKGHTKNNLTVGNDKATIIAAITQCMPYNGCPRTLNALNAVNEVIPG